MRQPHLPELSDATIIAHFKGNDDRLRDVIGQYVLDSDSNTKSWSSTLTDPIERSDKRHSACRKNHGIDAAVERSRSGNGAHVWFFFLELTSAKIAREFGSSLITEAAALNKTITFEAFDRMLPAQSTIPEGGFGNLIALPFQGKAQRKGTVYLLTSNLSPFPIDGFTFRKFS